MFSHHVGEQGTNGESIALIQCHYKCLIKKACKMSAKTL